MQDTPCFPSLTRPANDGFSFPPTRRPAWLRMCTGVGMRAAVICLVAQTWVVQGYKVFGHCMEPNLYTGERVLGSKVNMLDGVHRGDVVIFQPPHKPDSAYIKRVVAMPGEVVEIRNSTVYVDGRALNEPYLRRAWHDNRPPERVPEDKVFVLGDNRDQSNDSRAWGELPLDHIYAKAVARYWPPERAGLIR